MRKPNGARLPCNECLCARCSCLFCMYEKYYRSLPVNGGCYHCLMINNDTAIKDCEFFSPFSPKPFFKIRYKRRKYNSYERLARLIASTIKEFKKLDK